MSLLHDSERHAVQLEGIVHRVRMYFSERANNDPTR